MLGASERLDGQQEQVKEGQLMGQDFVLYSESRGGLHEGMEHQSDVLRTLQLMHGEWPEGHQSRSWDLPGWMESQGLGPRSHPFCLWFPFPCLTMPLAVHALRPAAPLLPLLAMGVPS